MDYVPPRRAELRSKGRFYFKASFVDRQLAKRAFLLLVM
jgi:hypothetical protein